MKHRALIDSDSVTINGVEIKSLSRYETDMHLVSGSLYINILFDDDDKDFNAHLKTLFNSMGFVTFIHKRGDRVITKFHGLIISIRKVFAFDHIEMYTVTIESDND